MQQKPMMQISHQQRQVMTPQMQQALKLLQVPTLELQQILKEELTQNPFLEEVDEFAEVEDHKAEGDENPLERQEEESVTAESEAATETKDEIDWSDYSQDDFDRMPMPQGETNSEFFEKVPVRRESLVEHLTTELHMLPLSEDDQALGEIIVGSLDDRGYLATSVEELAEFAKASVEDVLRLLGIVQTLEPAGVGARDLRECLLIQLKARDQEGTLAWRIIESQFENLKNNKRADIARALKVTVEQVQDATDSLGTLSPKPGFELSAEEARYVVPDLIVERVGDEYVAFLNDRNVPRLRINQAYQSVLSGKQKSGREEKKYVTDKLSAARWLIKTIDQRRRTMINVMTCIISEQREFFDKGIQFLRPLTLQAIARQVNVHESTVSRVTNSKYVQTPRGIFELKFFFSSGLTTDDGEDVSARTARDRIKNLIGDEDSKDPLSDQKIADLLQGDGLNIARRTVAKYREQLGILPARIRRRV